MVSNYFDQVVGSPRKRPTLRQILTAYLKNEFHIKIATYFEVAFNQKVIYQTKIS